jgi:hypothetical protein
VVAVVEEGLAGVGDGDSCAAGVDLLVAVAAPALVELADVDGAGGEGGLLDCNPVP